MAVSPSPNSAHLIRWTRQRAFNLKAEWTALFVETGAPLGDAAQESLRKNMNLARQLGAAMVTVPSDNVPLAVIRFARSRGITEIVVGKAGIIGGQGLFRRRTIAEQIMKMSGDIDVAVVQEKGKSLARQRVKLSSYLRAERASIAKMVLAIALVTGVNLLALPVIGYRSASILYLMTVIGLAFFTSRAAVLIAAGLSALLWNYFFLPPRFTFLITKLEDVLMFFLYFTTAAALAFLMSRLRVNQKMLGIRARRMSLLLDLSQSLSHQRTLEGLLTAGMEYVSRYFEVEVIAFLPDVSGGLERAPRSLTGIEVDEKEYSVARWCFDSRTPCGAYTDTLHMARFHYVPLLTPDAAVGVLGVSRAEGTAWLPEQEDSLQMLGRTLSLSIERELLAEENRRNMMARESERLGRVLLNTVSHELRTPLTAIKGSITALMDPVTGRDEEARRLLMAETLTATDRLNAIVENLLSMSRLESGMLRLKRSATDVMDLVSVAADAMRSQSSEHPLSISVEEDVPAVSLDFTLMAQVLSNLLTNAVRHTPRDAGPGGRGKDRGRHQHHRCRRRPRGGPRRAAAPLRDVLPRKERRNGRRGAGASHLQGHRGSPRGKDRRVHQPQGRAVGEHRPAPEHRAADGQPGLMTTVVVVDDEPQIRRLLRVSLETQGFSVHLAATGEEGLRLVQGRKPDIVLLDLGLPDRDGTEVLAALREWSSVPVIILSVRNAEEEIVRLLDAGADDYLVKPFSTGELIARMRVAIRHHAPAGRRADVHLRAGSAWTCRTGR